MKKTFNDRRLDSVTEQMIAGTREDVVQAINQNGEVEEVIFKRPESKTKRVNLLIRPSLYERLKKRTEKEYISINEQINQYIEEMLEKRGY